MRSLGQGGKGLLWNPFQSCGGPFFANGVIGVLNPRYLPFLVLDANVAVHVVLVIDMVLGAVGMLLLARQPGLAWVAALGGACLRAGRSDGQLRRLEPDGPTLGTVLQCWAR